MRSKAIAIDWMGVYGAKSMGKMTTQTLHGTRYSSIMTVIVMGSFSFVIFPSMRLPPQGTTGFGE